MSEPTPDDSELAKLRSENARLKERLREQTLATQQAAQFWHHRVVEVLRRYDVLPDSSYDHLEHPIDQVVGTSISGLLGRLEKR